MWTKWTRMLLVSGGLGLATVGILLVSPAWLDSSVAQAKETKEVHPHIRAAIRELREAKKELETADHDFGGHRKDAVKATQVAIEQLESALKYDKK
jgi:hypothetical protein